MILLHSLSLEKLQWIPKEKLHIRQPHVWLREVNQIFVHRITQIISYVAYLTLNIDTDLECFLSSVKQALGGIESMRHMVWYVIVSQSLGDSLLVNLCGPVLNLLAKISKVHRGA